jgi:hypothetical protein
MVAKYCKKRPSELHHQCRLRDLVICGRQVSQRVQPAGSLRKLCQFETARLKEDKGPIGFVSELLAEAMDTIDEVDMFETRPYCVDFQRLPPEIHGQIIRYCGVDDVYTLLLVNHHLHSIVRSKLREFLVSACQNGKFDS